jgi:hypothetical protein
MLTCFYLYIYLFIYLLLVVHCQHHYKRVLYDNNTSTKI